jgi:hypothetical protein
MLALPPRRQESPVVSVRGARASWVAVDLEKLTTRLPYAR